MEALGKGAVSYERGTPVRGPLSAPLLTQRLDGGGENMVSDRVGCSKVLCW